MLRSELSLRQFLLTKSSFFILLPFTEIRGLVFKLSRNFPTAGLKLRVPKRKIIFLFLNQNICCGSSKNRLNEMDLMSTQNMLKIMGKKLFPILRRKFLFSKPVDKDLEHKQHEKLTSMQRVKNPQGRNQ